VLAKGRDPEGLEGTQEVTSTSGGERVFIVQRDFKNGLKIILRGFNLLLEI
jgi:hypothetical protein